MFSYVALKERIPDDHSLPPMRTMVDETLAERSPRLSKPYTASGGTSIPPERSLRALRLQLL